MTTNEKPVTPTPKGGGGGIDVSTSATSAGGGVVSSSSYHGGNNGVTSSSGTHHHQSENIMSRFVRRLKSSGTHHERENILIRFVRRVDKAMFTGLKIAVTVSLLATYMEYKRLNSNNDGNNNNNNNSKRIRSEETGDEKKQHKTRFYNNHQSKQNDVDDDKGTTTNNQTKRKVLVIPFDRLRIVERKDPDWKADISKSIILSDTNIIEMEVKELVRVLHTAATDSTVVALYGIFGHGTDNGLGGWSDCEEIRNALRVFRESHRQHYEPNMNYLNNNETDTKSSSSSRSNNNNNNNNKPKPMYAYTNTFSSLMDPANKEYYIASIFHTIHMQQTGELNLLGMISSNFFIKDFCNKYGITIHVWKQGQYKNAPNMFTNTSYNKAHKYNVMNLLENINSNICQEISTTRTITTSSSSSIQSSASVAKIGKKSNNNNIIIEKEGNYNNNNQNIQELWKQIYQIGCFPATTALNMGFIDYIPHRDPLIDLVQSNKNKAAEIRAKNKEEEEVQKKKKQQQNDNNESKSDNSGMVDKKKVKADSIESLWKVQETDFQNFPAQEIIGLREYYQQIKKKEEILKRKKQWEDVAKKYPKLQPILKFLKFLPEEEAVVEKKEKNDAKKNNKTKSKEKIALLTLNEGIGDDTARNMVSWIRKIKNDGNVKCIVLRITSPGGSIFACENIVQELKSLRLPIIVSFGNVAASGGYYIAANADRIFASNKTITGSIGVFAVRMDLTALAKQYGINVDHVTVGGGELAGVYNAFHPLNNKMKDIFADSIDRYYDQFKKIVADGRNLPMDYVHSVGQGRVWTGNQAKSNGLVDEIGGLHRAIAYAQRNYCQDSGEGAIIEEWPKKVSFFEQILELQRNNQTGENNKLKTILWAGAYEWISEMFCNNNKIYGNDNMNRQDKNVENADEILLNWLKNNLRTGKRFPCALSGVLLMSDENSAIQFLLENAKKQQHFGQNRNHSINLPNSFWA